MSDLFPSLLPDAVCDQCQVTHVTVLVLDTLDHEDITICRKCLLEAAGAIEAHDEDAEQSDA